MLAVANSSVPKYLLCTAACDMCVHYVTLLWPSTQVDTAVTTVKTTHVQ
jgi:hypothetical protein